MISPELLALLRCPVTQQPLAFASAEVLAEAERRRLAGALLDSSGKPILASLSAALMRADGRLLYPIRNDIPVLLSDAGIPI